ncbi:MAG: insulinase family protein [Armatimonadetes bacterium]|nr:insulinase family protein [Armatimonadota bacterium]
MRRLLLVLWIVLAPLPVFAQRFAQHGQGPSSEDRGKPPSKTGQAIEKLVFPALKWPVPEVGKDVQREVLPNGIVVYLKEDHALPLVEVKVLVRTGSVFEKPAEHGVAALTGALLRAGGTTTLDAETLNRKLESMSAELETSIGLEEGVATLDVLSKDVSQALPLLADVLLHPRLDPTKLELLREQYHESLRRRNDDPDTVANREFDKVLYGAHPYGRELDWEVLKKMKREDVLAWYDKFFHPSLEAVGRKTPATSLWQRPNVMIAVSGDFKSDEMLATLRRLFGGWEPRKITAAAPPKVQNTPRPGVFVVKKELAQSHVLVGHLSTNRYSPDRVPIAVMNYILGGGSFSSRVMEKIRNDEGLAYSAGTYFSINTTDLGEFVGYLETKAESTHKAVALLVEEIKRMASGEVTEKELAAAREAYANSFIFGFGDASQTVARLMQLEFNDEPRDYYQTYLDKVRAVKVEDVARVAKQHLQPEKLTILVVGNPSKFDRALDALGPLKTIPLKPVQ